jgi:hypothetical protein
MSKYAEKKRLQALAAAKEERFEAVQSALTHQLAQQKTAELQLRKTRFVRNGHWNIRLGNRRIAIMQPLVHQNQVLGYYGVGEKDLFWRYADAA